MPKPRQPMLSVLAEAVDAGWMLSDFSMRRSSFLRFAGKDWELVREIGRHPLGLEAVVRLYPRDRGGLDFRVRLPAGRLLTTLHQIQEQFESLGYEGNWDLDFRNEPSGHFRKMIRGRSALRRERKVLEGLRLDEAKPRRS